ncbi:MAG: hypothetical protein NXI24_22335 [bacterium]|nr:hypothetical protein [bacterium]
MLLSEQIALSGAGIFFLIGLLSGVWKYLAIVASSEARAHEYVDILHRASLMYGFAGIVVWKFAELSIHDEVWNLIGVLGLNVFFAFAILTYLIHAVSKDTDNQLRPPYVLGGRPIPGFLIHGGMWLLIAGEVGGFLILFSGAWPAIWFVF